MSFFFSFVLHIPNEVSPSRGMKKNNMNKFCQFFDIVRLFNPCYPFLSK